jgi:hypothetical protein
VPKFAGAIARCNRNESTRVLGLERSQGGGRCPEHEPARDSTMSAKDGVAVLASSPPRRRGVELAVLSTSPPPPPSPPRGRPIKFARVFGVEWCVGGTAVCVEASSSQARWPVCFGGSDGCQEGKCGEKRRWSCRSVDGPKSQVLLRPSTLRLPIHGGVVRPCWFGPVFIFCRFFLSFLKAELFLNQEHKFQNIKIFIIWIPFKNECF